MCGSLSGYISQVSNRRNKVEMALFSSMKGKLRGPLGSDKSGRASGGPVLTSQAHPRENEGFLILDLRGVDRDVGLCVTMVSHLWPSQMFQHGVKPPRGVRSCEWQKRGVHAEYAFSSAVGTMRKTETPGCSGGSEGQGVHVHGDQAMVKFEVVDEFLQKRLMKL